eukprot:scaffold35237_cov72-Cyclotella_meneghiniana.AAC.2
MGIDRMFWDSNSWALDRTNSSILLLVCTVLIGGEELIRRHGDERSDGRCLRRRVLNGRRAGNSVMVYWERGRDGPKQLKQGQGPPTKNLFLFLAPAKDPNKVEPSQHTLLNTSDT